MGYGKVSLWLLVHWLTECKEIIYQYDCPGCVRDHYEFFGRFPVGHRLSERGTVDRFAMRFQERHCSCLRGALRLCRWVVVVHGRMELRSGCPGFRIRDQRCRRKKGRRHRCAVFVGVDGCRGMVLRFFVGVQVGRRMVGLCGDSRSDG